MALSMNNFNFCKEIGIMKENISHQAALDTIKKAVREKKQADPKYVEYINKLTLNSPEVSVRVCVLYQYNLDVDYVVGGNIKNTRIVDFGYSGCPDSLHITEYSGKGEYTVIKNVADVKYSIYNDHNLFTLESMKKALTKAVEEHLPSNCTSFQSKEWDVYAYLVPVLVLITNYGGVERQLYYNLHNNYYHYKWANNPVLLKRGKQAKNLTGLLRFAGIAFTIGAIISSISNFSEHILSLLMGIAYLMVQIIVYKKTKKSKTEFENIFLKDIDKSVPQALIKQFIFTGISLLILIFSFIF